MFSEPTNNPLVRGCDECETPQRSHNRKHDHGNICLKILAVENIVVFCESAELFQNLEHVNSLTERKNRKMKYEKLKQSIITKGHGERG